jgi:hypothetical protein
MTKLSSKIKKSAKTLRKEKYPSYKLTEIQNNLAREEGYNSFKHLVTQEKVNEKENLKKNAYKGKESKGRDIIEFINKNVGVFVSNNGQRGLKALKDFNSGDILFTEEHYLYAGLSEIINDEGLPWTLTRNIIFKFPYTVEDMQTSGNFYPHFKPKLSSEDKMILSTISLESGKSKDEIQLIYNLVCTYSYRIHLQHIQGSEALIGERIIISRGLSYANHSCDPNSSRIENGLDTFQRKYDGLIATQKIKKGEEITWSYIGSSIPKDLKDRRNQIIKILGFTCECLYCKKK